MKHTDAEMPEPGCFKSLVLAGKDHAIFITDFGIDSKKKRRGGKGEGERMGWRGASVWFE